jgi:hypothetical protein
MMDPLLMRLNEVLFRERLETAALARRQAPKPASRNPIAQLRSAIEARLSQPALPARKLQS